MNDSPRSAPSPTTPSSRQFVRSAQPARTPIFGTNHLIEFHSGGEGSILPSGNSFTQFPERAPIQLGGDIAHFDAGWNAAVAILGACYDRLRTGRGQTIDVSVQESQLTLNRTRLSRFTNDGVAIRRAGNRYGIGGMLRCSDGYVQLVGIAPQQIQQLADAPDNVEFHDPLVATAEARAQHPEQTGAALAAWCLARPKAEVVAALNALGSPVGAYAEPADLLASEQLEQRRFFSTVDDGRGGTLKIPGPPYSMSDSPPTPTSAPTLGSASGFRSPSHSQPSTPPTLPPGRGLEGVRVLDFTWAAAGPYATLLLALLGADVVKVESSRRPDPARRGFMADYGGINRSPNFNELNLNKRSVNVDMSADDGRALVRRLVMEWADVVIDNFRPGVMTRFGLDAPTLLAERPELIVVSSSANGSTGPEAMMAGVASVFGATGGLSEQTGYPDGPPTEVGESTDYRSANAMAVGILAALLHRAQTGRGQHVDVASREVVIASAPDALLAHGLGVEWHSRVGNLHRDHTPHDVYPTAEPDRWVAVAATNDDEWHALCAVLGRPEWAKQFSSVSDRRRHSDEIDTAITSWTRQQSPGVAFTTLASGGRARHGSDDVRFARG